MTGIVRIDWPQGILNKPVIVKPADTSVTALVTLTRCVVIDVTVTSGTPGADASLYFYDGTTQWLIGVYGLSADSEHVFARKGFQLRADQELRCKSSVGDDLTFMANLATSSSA